MQHLHGAKFPFGCPGHRVGDGLPQRSSRKVQGQEGSRPRERGGGATLLVMRLGRDEGHPKGLIYPAGKRQASGKPLGQAALVYIVGGPQMGRKRLGAHSPEER